MTGSVRSMTGETIFRRRSVLPEERTALLGMTLKTFFVDGIGRDQFFGDRTVRIVAVGTGHLTFPDRMVRRFF